MTITKTTTITGTDPDEYDAVELELDMLIPVYGGTVTKTPGNPWTIIWTRPCEGCAGELT